MLYPLDKMHSDQKVHCAWGDQEMGTATNLMQERRKLLQQNTSLVPRLSPTLARRAWNEASNMLQLAFRMASGWAETTFGKLH